MSADYRDPDKPPSKSIGRDVIETEVTLTPAGPIPPYIKLGPTLGRVPGGLGTTRTPMEDYEASVAAHAARYAVTGMEQLAGQLLDKGEDVNLRARVLDLAAKWAALGKTDDRADKYAVAYRACAGELRALARARPVTRTLTPDELEYRRPEQLFSPENLETLRGVPGVGSVEADADGLGITVTASRPRVIVSPDSTGLAREAIDALRGRPVTRTHIGPEVDGKVEITLIADVTASEPEGS